MKKSLNSFYFILLAKLKMVSIRYNFSKDKRSTVLYKLRKKRAGYYLEL
jgi:hypothetical protein